ncbi:uncharacterized protein O3C94_005821 [Discoglossus pictus]
MTAQLKKTPRLCGNVQTAIEPRKLHLHRTKKSESLLGIAGMALGLQNDSFTITQLETKATKRIPSNGGMERIRKTMVSKSVQVSSENENLFLAKIQALEKENLSLKASLKEKCDSLLALTKDIEDKSVQYHKNIEMEINSHVLTRKQLEECQSTVKEKEQLLEENMEHYEKVTTELQKQFEETMTSLQEQKQSDINIRDEKITKLKQQIAELFKEKSWEHQHQIEEFQKELNQLSEETQLLRKHVKRQDTLKRECDQCKSLMSDLEDKMLQLKLKNRTIEELQSTCRKFEKQLKQQERLQNVLVAKNIRNIK